MLDPQVTTLALGDTVRLAALDTMHDTIPQTCCLTWTTSDSATARVGAAGVVAAVSVGTTTVRAQREDGAWATATVTVRSNPDLAVAALSGYYVGPNGSSSNDGSISRPWDLQSALSGSKRIAAGSTVWVRGGTYRPGEVYARLSGAIVRAYPGEHPAIDGNLAIVGANTTYWGLEIYRSNPLATNKMGVNVRAPGTRLINNVIHDASGTGVGFWMEAPNSEATGNIVYNNGTHGNQDHGFYVQNSSGTKLLRDNLVFTNSGYGFHLYVSDGQYARNVTLDGNVAWNNGTIASARPDYFAGGSTAESGIVVKNNFSFRNDGAETADLGWLYGATHKDLTLTNNYIVGSLHVARWSTVTQSGNTVLRTAPSSGTKVVVRPNPYEAGRANVIVYNWARQSSIAVNPGVLKAGDGYEVRNVQNYYDTPVLSGTYAGGALTLPLSAITAPKPIGRTTAKAPTTGPLFNAYVILRRPG
jgi:parallel beta helix pectate lyase-like protein/Big-like domain-containing protein